MKPQIEKENKLKKEKIKIEKKVISSEIRENLQAAENKSKCKLRAYNN